MILIFFTNLIKYFDDHYEQFHEDGEHEFSGTTLRGWHAMFKKYFKMTGRGKLEDLIPQLNDNISKWEKEQTVVKAKTFSKEELLEFYQMPHTESTLPMKVYAILDMAFAGRGSETHALKMKKCSKID